MKSLRILIVEDDAIIGMLLGEVLAGMGHSLCGIAVTEREAIAMAAQFSPDLMLVEAELDDGSGVSAVAEILRGGFLPHIFITGDLLGVPALKRDRLVLEKPFLECDLIRLIPQALQTAAATG
jgi:CheY-like chemotaxis protein